MNTWRWIYKKSYEALAAIEKAKNKYSSIGELLCYGISKCTNLEEVIHVFNKYLVRNYKGPNIVPRARDTEVKIDMVSALMEFVV